MVCNYKKRCAKCKILFIPNNASAKYCDECSGRKKIKKKVVGR